MSHYTAMAGLPGLRHTDQAITARARMLELARRLLAMEREGRPLPGRLAGLVGEDEAWLLVDPFGEGPFGYRPPSGGAGFALWSAWVDLDDDGGAGPRQEDWGGDSDWDPEAQRWGPKDYGDLPWDWGGLTR